jgi:hypothetical protein
MLHGNELQKKYGIDKQVLIDYLVERKYMSVIPSGWKLEDRGYQVGAMYSDEINKEGYILWPEKIEQEIVANLVISKVENDKLNNDSSKRQYVTVSKIAEQFGLESTKANMILSEIGWIDKDPILGWRVTDFGKKLGAVEKEYLPTGVHYVVWPTEIVQNNILVSLFESYKSQSSEPNSSDGEDARINKFRQDLPGTYRTKDGHWVRSRAEVIIDDALYYYEVPHAYERKIPVEEDLYSDFYLPQVKVYIEFWGLEEQTKYLERKKKKIALYRKYNLHLIELNDSHIHNLDDHLPRFLLKYGLRVF